MMTLSKFGKLLTPGALCALTALASLSVPEASAQDGILLPEDATSFCEWLSNAPKLYKADKEKNSVIQEFNVTLRMQYQVGWVDPNGDAVGTQAGGYQDEFRRFRLGANAKMFNGKLKLATVWNVGGVPGRRKNMASAGMPQDWANGDNAASLYELYAEYTTNLVLISFGCLKPAFTSEYRTSSSAILTVERSVLVNQLRSETNYGIWFKNPGKDDKLGWNIGTFLNGMDGGTRMDEPEFSSQYGCFLMTGVNYDTSGFITKKGRIWLDYVHNFSDAVDEKLPSQSRTWGSTYRGVGAEDILALSWDMSEGPWSFVTEILGGMNVNKNTTSRPANTTQNVWGVVFMPSYKFNPNWEAVFRYQYANGTDAIKTEGRYIAGGSTGATRNAASLCDQLNAFYIGVNYYICESNPNMMKVMLGAEYSNYDNDRGVRSSTAFNGWSYYLAFRTNF